MSNITIQTESIVSLIEELQPLLLTHWDEITAYRQMPLNVNWPFYIEAEQAGAFKLYTARENQDLVGYLAYFVGPHPHYATTYTANEDVFFVAKHKRTGTTGLRLLKYAEAALVSLGVSLLIHHSKIAHDLGPILVRRGFSATDKLYSKHL